MVWWLRAGHAVTKLKRDEAHEERVERPASYAELLGDLAGGTVVRDHRGEGRHLTGRPPGMRDGGSALAGSDAVMA